MARFSAVPSSSAEIINQKPVTLILYSPLKQSRRQIPLSQWRDSAELLFTVVPEEHCAVLGTDIHIVVYVNGAPWDCVQCPAFVTHEARTKKPVSLIQKPKLEAASSGRIDIPISISLCGFTAKKNQNEIKSNFKRKSATQAEFSLS